MRFLSQMLHGVDACANRWASRCVLLPLQGRPLRMGPRASVYLLLALAFLLAAAPGLAWLQDRRAANGLGTMLPAFSVIMMAHVASQIRLMSQPAAMAIGMTGSTMTSRMFFLLSGLYTLACTALEAVLLDRDLLVGGAVAGCALALCAALHGMTLLAAPHPHRSAA